MRKLLKKIDHFLAKKLNNLLCWCGIHDWRMGPGSECCNCYYPDTMFDDPVTAQDRMNDWKAQ
jgi:hypothetical protein